MSFNLASCAHYTLMDFSPIVDLSRSLKTNIFVKFAPLWNVMRSCFITNHTTNQDTEQLGCPPGRNSFIIK